MTSPDNDLDPELRAAVRAEARELIREEMAEMEGTRRDFLTAAGSGSLAGLLVGGGLSGMASRGAADPSTSDSDPDIGGPNDRVDAWFDGVDAQSVATGELSGNSRPVVYDVYTDGSTIYGIPNKNEYDDLTFDRLEYTDIGEFADELVINQLPPQGSQKFGIGRVKWKRGNYPGKLSNGTLPGLPLFLGTYHRGEANTHFNDSAASVVPADSSTTGVWMESDDEGIVGPNVDGEFVTYAGVENITFTGPGAATTTGGTQSSGPTGILERSNPLDWVWFDNVVIQRFYNPLEIVSDAHVTLWKCQFRQFAGQADLLKRWYSYGSTFATGHEGATVRLRQGRFVGGGLHCVGEPTAFCTVGEGAVLAHPRIEKISGTDGSGTAIANKGRTIGVIVDPSELGFDSVIFLDKDGESYGTEDRSSSTNTYKISPAAVEPKIYGSEENGVADATKGRFLRQGTWGLNDGDPNTTGNWNGNGLRGVVVEDYSNGNLYTYLPSSGSWEQFSFV